ncbi:extensin-like domain-containing protein [Hyphomicrobium sp.]|uniref:extensin-like domain-containing protein n=1 Tax=Hyphomicrobium sp. TaxID=82 RepID=UPI002FDD25FC
MSLRIAPFTRYRTALGIALAVLASAEAHAGDASIPEAVTSAFETIVIDARKAASKATAAAKGAVDARKQKRAASQHVKPKHKPAREDAGKKADGSARESQAPASPASAPSAKDAATGAAPGEAEAAPAKKPLIATEWPATDVELARARCTQLLKGVDAVAIPEPPFRKGDCGTMAPVRLVSIGKDPEVALSPPPVVTCDLVVALAKWIETEVQPAAKRHLGSAVIRMESMSDYSCRMAYGRIGNKLSEHGKANALDIRSFTTQKGSQAIVLTHWGETRRDVLRRLVAEKKEAEKAAIAKAAAEKAAKDRMEIAEAAAKGHVTSLPRPTIAEGVSKNDKAPLALRTSITGDGKRDAKRPSSLGGPKETAFQNDAALKAAPTKDAAVKDATLKNNAGKATAKRKRRSREEAALLAALPPDAAAKVAAPPPKTAAARFLREIHASGCRIFGTTLGPEANEAHRNHFHVDMAERKVHKICD